MKVFDALQKRAILRNMLKKHTHETMITRKVAQILAPLNSLRYIPRYTKYYKLRTDAPF